jgi:hypothetical protein
VISSSPGTTDLRSGTRADAAIDVVSASPRTAAIELIARALVDMTEAAKLETLVRLGKRQLAGLFELAVANPPLELSDLVPADVPSRVEVIHEGKNSLLAFTRFQKRFCRPPGSDRSELWGYNQQRMGPLTGPGYFIAHHAKEGEPGGEQGGDPKGERKGELVIDYRRLPDGTVDDRPPAWPRPIPNSARLGRFVYHDMVDVLRRVAPSFTVGRAYRRGGAIDVWFGLVGRSPGGGSGSDSDSGSRIGRFATEDTSHELGR